MIVSMQPELKVISKNDAKDTMTLFWNKQGVFVAAYGCSVEMFRLKK